MKSTLTLAALLFAVLLVQGYARTASLSEGTHRGTVEALFVQSQPGVFVPPVAADAKPGATVWVHVRFAQALDDGRRFAVAALPGHLRVAPGDVVEMRFGDLAAGPGTAPAHNTVTALVARQRPH